MTNSYQFNDSKASHAAGLHDKLHAAIVQLKSRLQARYDQCLPGKDGQVREIIEAAEAAAWQTSFPHLFLPEFADEGITRLMATQPAGFTNDNSCFAVAA